MKTAALILITLFVSPPLVSAQLIDVAVGADVDVRSPAASSTIEAQASTSEEMLRVNALGVPVSVSAQVYSDADLKVYSENVRIRDENVAGIRAEGDVAVDYYHSGKLFGLFPVKVKSTTTVTRGDDGTMRVKTTMPWWNMFVAGTGRIAASIDKGLDGSLSAEVDVGARARAIEAVTKAHARADATLSAGR